MFTEDATVESSTSGGQTAMQTPVSFETSWQNLAIDRDR
jgi:hypothetical protein